VHLRELFSFQFVQEQNLQDSRAGPTQRLGGKWRRLLVRWEGHPLRVLVRFVACSPLAESLLQPCQHGL